MRHARQHWLCLTLIKLNYYNERKKREKKVTMQKKVEESRANAFSCGQIKRHSEEGNRREIIYFQNYNLSKFTSR